MLLATLMCSDEGCAAELDLAVEELGDVEATACACGCVLVVLAVSEWEPAELPLARRARAGDLAPWARVTPRWPTSCAPAG